MEENNKKVGHQKIHDNMIVFDENIPYKDMMWRMKQYGYTSVPINQTDLRGADDLKIVKELKKHKGVVLVTSDNRMYWRCAFSRVPCIYLSIEGALLDVFMKNFRMFVDEMERDPGSPRI